MSAQEIESMLRDLLTPAPYGRSPLSADDWRRLESKFACRFGDDFKAFMGLMSRFDIPGEILMAAAGQPYDNDSIELTFDTEMATGDWDSSMIPFYAVGNGDYYCLHRTELPSSKVYYYWHDRREYEPDADSFWDWLRNLPALWE